MLQQGGLDLHRVLSPIGDWDLLDRVRDRGRMLGTNHTIRESLSNCWVNRLQRFAGQRPPSPEPLHRLRPPPSLHPGPPHLAGDQVSQPTQPKPARNVASLQLGQHLQLPVLHPSQLSFQRAQLSKQLRIRNGCQLLDHMFDSTLRTMFDQSSTSRKPI